MSVELVMSSLQGREVADGSGDPSQKKEETRRDTEGSRARQTSHKEGTVRVTYLVVGHRTGTRNTPLKW